MRYIGAALYLAVNLTIMSAIAYWLAQFGGWGDKSTWLAWVPFAFSVFGFAMRGIWMAIGGALVIATTGKIP